MTEAPISQAKKFAFIPVLAAIGVVYSAIFPVNRMSMEAGLPYIGYVFWFSLLSTLLLFAAAALMRELPKLSFAHLRAYAVIGAVAVAIPVPLLTFVAPKLPVGIITLILILVPLITYLISYFLGIERFRVSGVIGVLFGFAGMLLVLVPEVSLPSRDMVGWVVLALIAPLCFALSNVFAIYLRPPGAPSIMMAAGMSAGATVLLAPVMVASGHAFLLPWSSLDGNLAVLFAATISATTLMAWFVVVKIVGAVFFSQFNYFIVLGGFGWGALLYGESHSVYIWIATALTFLGLAIFTRGASVAGRAPAASGSTP